MAAFGLLAEYFGRLIAMKRANPAQDLMTALIEARDEHDRLTEMELVIMCVALLVAGHETTANQINMCPADAARVSGRARTAACPA